VVGNLTTGEYRPPTCFVVLDVLLAVVGLIGMCGLTRGARWAVPLIYGTRAPNVVNNVLGLATNPNATRAVTGSLVIGRSGGRRGDADCVRTAGPIGSACRDPLDEGLTPDTPKPPSGTPGRLRTPGPAVGQLGRP
jgi:hypothetical protein